MPVCSVFGGPAYFEVKPICFPDSSDEKRSDFAKFNCWVYNFYRIFQDSSEDTELVDGFKPKDILHTVAGLFLATLQSMDKETVYAALLHSSSFTLVCYVQKVDAVAHIRECYAPESKQANVSMTQLEILSFSDKVDAYDESQNVCSEDNDFRLVYPSEFSDTSEDSLEEGNENASSPDHILRSQHSSASEWSDDSEVTTKLMGGYKAFIGGCLGRKLHILSSMKSEDSTGIENDMLIANLASEHLIAAACNLRVRYPTKHQRIIHITLLAVRRFMRRKKLGTMVMNILMKTEVVGPYDAIVVHADIDAKSFFEKFGFTDDILINHAWADFAGEYTNCRLMTYLPGFSRHKLYIQPCISGVPTDSYLSWLNEFDGSMQRWKTDAELAHRSQFTFYSRIREEMKFLQTALRKQNEHIYCLYEELIQAYTQILSSNNPEVNNQDTDGINQYLADISKRMKELEKLKENRNMSFCPEDKTFVSLTEGSAAGGDKGSTKKPNLHCGDYQEIIEPN
ncbi:hypothetical protein AHF37_10907 [Paragonimus kellicotti]|nr:hypothetical protein AHF37_10907 [Paragonimus kellicotti]